MEELELLAPAGDLDSFFAAVHSGADAVYVGAGEFNARRNANNFDRDDLARLIEYAHHHEVREHVAVNTLVKNDELGRLLALVNALYTMGADALILADLGLVHLVRTLFPDQTIHASTQLTVHNAAGVRYLRACGVSTVVAARENTLDDLRIMSRQGAAIEAFVHGALCVCYSGQCLMSSMIGGRSGNRGLCAQPCRLPYRLYDEQEQLLSEGVGDHLLSPKDLNTLENLDEMVRAGVRSFKIEGRMKRAEYVATVVAAYRSRLDAIRAGMDPEPAAESQKDIKQIFNRQFTSGYLHGNPGRDLMSYARPNNRGVQLGRIRSSAPRGFVIDLKEDLCVGDGLEIWVSKGGRKGFTVETILRDGETVTCAQVNERVTVVYGGRVFEGDRVFRTHDSTLMQRARKTFEGRELDIPVPLDVHIEGRSGEPLHMRLAMQDGSHAQGDTEHVLEAARNRALTEGMLKEKMRFGNTPFEMESFSVQLEGDLMIPISQVNALRRRLAEALLAQRRQTRPALDESSQAQPVREWRRPGPQKASALALSVEVDSDQEADAALRAGADVALVHLCGLREKEGRVGSSDHPERIWRILPRIIRPKDEEKMKQKIRDLAGRCAGFVAPNTGAIQLLQEAGVTEIWGDYSLNCMNNLALAHLGEQGLTGLCVSPELTLAETAGLASDRPLEVLVHGAIPLMTSEHCPVGALQNHASDGRCAAPCRNKRYHLKDRKGYRFRLLMQTDCTMQIINARELCLIEELEALAGSSVQRVRLLLRERPIAHIERVTALYRQALDALNQGRPSPDLRSVLQTESPYGLTKGHAYREVK